MINGHGQTINYASLYKYKALEQAYQSWGVLWREHGGNLFPTSNSWPETIAETKRRACQNALKQSFEIFAF